MITQLQVDLAKWQEKNFSPEVSTPIHLALGVCEEAGELAHAVLKKEQGIRKSSNEKIVDAACDTIIYCLQVLSKLNVNAEVALCKTASQVMSRDWSINPEGKGFSQHKEM